MKETILYTPPNIAFAKEIVKRLPQAIRSGLPGEISVVSVSLRESRALNRQYRKKNAPADVLSFLYDKEYGEIIICPSLIRHEAKKQKRTFQYQMTWMIVHGMIHLSGLHHERSAAHTKRSERIEQRILARLFSHLSSPRKRGSRK